MRVTVFGLGEAGSLIAGDLADAGAEVHAFDPAPVATPDGVIRHDEAESTVDGSTLIIAVTAAADARLALAQAFGRIETGTIYADLSTAAPGLKFDLADQAAGRGISFADVALMAPVPGHGLATPAIAAGPGAEAMAGMLNELGAVIDVISDRPGDASARKLLRSIVTKGLTSLLVESLEAGEAHGQAEWLWSHLVDFITDADEELMRRLIAGTPRHVERRIDEMEAAKTFLESLEVSPTMTSATVELLRQVRDEGVAADLEQYGSV